MKSSLNTGLIFVIYLLAFCATVSYAETNISNPEECLVIGYEANPVKGREHFKSAIDLWIKGQTTKAVEEYEKAIIADHSILKYEDHGMAKALLEKYRDANATQTPQLLCKRGFLENILIGNLSDSIKFYQEAAKIAKKPEIEQLAKAEANRLSDELKFIRDWQASVAAANARLRKKDLQDYLKREELKNKEEMLEDYSLEIEELQQRLAYLQQQEKKVAEEMYSYVSKAARYRRRYYYPGAYQTTTPDPDLQNVPEGSVGIADSRNLDQVANPYAGQPAYGATGERALTRYYIYRNSARQRQEKLAQIRAEISGIYRQIAQLQKAAKKIRQDLSDDAVSP
ncbi:MAG: hypothetical protein Kow0029_32240 [Candidatus Rifleibacteriota bacterium]